MQNLNIRYNSNSIYLDNITGLLTGLILQVQVSQITSHFVRVQGKSQSQVTSHKNCDSSPSHTTRVYTSLQYNILHHIRSKEFQSTNHA
jgi:hypothetical protein